jgi:hypothetical protein
MLTLLAQRFPNLKLLCDTKPFGKDPVVRLLKTTATDFTSVLRFFPKCSAVYASVFALKYTGAYTFNQVITAMQDLHNTHVGFLPQEAIDPLIANCPRLRALEVWNRKRSSIEILQAFGNS